jgi:hypothetical protein
LRKLSPPELSAMSAVNDPVGDDVSEVRLADRVVPGGSSAIWLVMSVAPQPYRYRSMGGTVVVAG